MMAPISRRARSIVSAPSVPRGNSSSKTAGARSGLVARIRILDVEEDTAEKEPGVRSERRSSSEIAFDHRPIFRGSIPPEQRPRLTKRLTRGFFLCLNNKRGVEQRRLFGRQVGHAQQRRSAPER